MGSWIYEWGDGDVTLVSAASKDEAAFLLDEIGQVDPKDLKPIQDRGFFVSFRKKESPKKDDFEYEKHMISESALGMMCDIYERRRKRKKSTKKKI